MEFIFELLKYKIATPKAYGLFHLIFIGLTILLIILFSLKFKNPSEKFINKLFLIVSVIMLLLELYKQIVFTFSYESFEVISDYQWYAFPFQFCSVPMYVYLLIPFTKGKVREALLAFSASYSLFAGTAVMLYPGDVFIDILGVSIQTMVHHGLMAVIGVYLLISKIVNVCFKSLLKATIVFSIVVIIALCLDYTFVKFIPEGETFNMFYISPHFDCTLPVLSIIYPKVPYIGFLIIYILGFSIVAGIVNLIYFGIYKLVCRFNKDENNYFYK